MPERRRRGQPEPTRLGEPIWLQPYPDALLEGLPGPRRGPEARYETQGGGRPRLRRPACSACRPAQRAVLVLRDVLGFRAAEVAEMLDSQRGLGQQRPAAGARGARRRARARGRRARCRDSRAERDAARALRRRLRERRRRRAWSRCSPTTPGSACRPSRTSTRAARRSRRSCGPGRSGSGGRGIRLVPTRANGQPAFGYYLGDPQAGVARAAGVFVLALDGDAICSHHALRRHRRPALLRAAADDPGLSCLRAGRRAPGRRRRAPAGMLMLRTRARAPAPVRPLRRERRVPPRGWAGTARGAPASSRG